MNLLRQFPLKGRAAWWTCLRLLPILTLGVWAFLVVRGAQTAGRELDHCSGWNLGIHRFQESYSAFHARASGLLAAESIPGEIARIQGMLPALRRERENLSQRAHGHPDSSLEAVDLAMTAYMAQWSRFQRASESREPNAMTNARVELAHLEHQDKEVVEALGALEAFHREGLDGAIRSSKTSTDQMLFFSFGSLFMALGFAIASGIAAHSKRKSKGQERLLKTLMDAIPEALLAWDQSGAVRWVNGGWWRMIGQSQRSISPGGAISALLPTGIPAWLQAHPNEGMVFNILHTDGRMLAVQGTLAVVHLDTGLLNLAVLRDTTLETVSERKRKEDERMIALGRDLVVKSRDLGRLLHPMLLAVDLLRTKGEIQGLKDPAWRHLDQGAEAASRLLSEISGYALSEGLQDHQELFDANLCVQEVAEGFLKEGHSLHGLSLDLSMDPALAEGSRNAFRESVELLIQRALDVNPNGDPVLIRTWIEKERFHLDVEDGGKAISPDHLSRVFDPTFVAVSKPGRSSVGLFNVAETMKAMHGRAKVEVTPEGRTRFCLSFPVEGDL